MFDPLMGGFPSETVFEIQERVYVLIRDDPLLQGDLRQQGQPQILQKPVVDLIQVFGHIQAVKFLLQEFQLFLRKIPLVQSLIGVREMLHHRPGPLQKRSLLETEIKHLDQFFLSKLHSFEPDLFEIHQPILQNCQESLHLSCKFLGLLPLKQCLLVFIRAFHHPFQLVVLILTVRRCVPQFVVSKKIKTHFPDLLFPQFRQDMGNIVREHPVWRQDQDVGGGKVLPVMIQKIGDPMKSDGCLPASCRTLDHQDLIPGIADDLILLFLDGTDNVFQLHIPVVAQLLLQDLVVDLGVALKPVHHFPVTDLILPLSAYFPADNSAGRLIRSRPPVEIIEQAAHRRSPIIDQRQPAVSFVKITDPNIDGLRI